MARTAKKAAKPIAASQIRRIHTIIHALRIDDDTYRAALAERFGVTTCKDLSFDQAQAFIREFEERARKAATESHPEAAPTEKQRFSDLDNRPDMASGAQLRKIEAMWQEVSIITNQAARNRALRRFVHRVAGVADLRFLDREGASKVINALNAMKK